MKKPSLIRLSVATRHFGVRSVFVYTVRQARILCRMLTARGLRVTVTTLQTWKHSIRAVQADYYASVTGETVRGEETSHDMKFPSHDYTTTRETLKHTDHFRIG